MRFLAKLKNFLNVSEDVFSQDEMAVQDKLAPLLRQKAVNHLANAQNVVAKNFRGEYVNAGIGNYRDFLNTQSREGSWGTYLEATALGEALGCHVVVTPVKGRVEQNAICLYRASDDNAPTIHLYNSNNMHWYTNNKTKGNGNCLFNAFAQDLQKIVTPEIPRPVAKTSGIVQQSFLNAKLTVSKENKSVIEHQTAIAAAIRNHPTPQELEADLLAEKTRISALSAAEQRQIADDHKYALALAREEMGYANKNIFSNNCSVSRSHSYRIK